MTGVIHKCSNGQLVTIYPDCEYGTMEAYDVRCDHPKRTWVYCSTAMMHQVSEDTLCPYVKNVIHEEEVQQKSTGGRMVII